MDSKLRFCKTLFVVGLLIASCGIRARAQYDDGSLIGSIHDATGAAVANVAVTVTNVNTGIVTKVTADGSGDYEVPSLRVGVYNIEASAPGFASAEARNITVSVGGRQRIDLTLSIGKAETTTVEVSDVALQIETETSERGQTVSGYQTASLPLVSRNYSDLLALVTGSRQAPTAATTTAVTSLVRAGAYNVNGLRSMFNNFLLDGMDNNAYGESNQGFDNQIIQPTPDAISQFQVVTNNESAEYGRSAGATINVASRSGTNQFHATLYEFNRNTDFNAFGYYHAVSGTHVFPKPGFNRNQFGVTFGGPIYKNKLFFFLDYEGFRQTLTPTTVFTVPTDNELGIGTTGGTPVLVTDVENPITGQYYKAGTPIPAAAINPTSLQILKAFASLPSQCLIPADSNLISTSGGTLGLATNDCAVNAPFTDKSDKGDLRIDYQQNERNSWFLKISDRKETGINHPTEPEPLDSQANGNGRTKILDQQVALGYTRLIGANKVLDVRLALSGTQAGKYSLAIGNNDITFPGLPTVAADPTVAGGLPTITFGSGFSSVGRQNTNPQWQNPSLLDPKVNFSWVKGRHSLKFGYEYEHIWMEVQDSNPLYGAFAYSGAFSACSAGTACSSISGNDELYWADFLFGTTSQYQLATFFKAHLLQTQHSWYAQDDWKVDSRLTLNLGVRWEYGSPYSEANNDLSNFDPTTLTMLTLTPGAKAGPFLTPYSGSGVYGKTLVNPSLGDYAPRIGFAYAVTPTIVIRGGYGTSFIHYTRAGSGDILPINAPNALFTTVNQSNPSPATHCTQTTGAATSCFATMDQGFPANLATATNFNPGTDNVTYIH
jgi:outer membrane receptor protein involved in Fe transport